MIRFSKLLPAIAAAALLATASSARATFEVTLWVNGGSSTIVDGGAGDADGGPNGSITVNSKTVANGGASYTFNVTVAQAGTQGDISFVNSTTNTITGTGTGTIQIVASADGFSSPQGVLQADSGATLKWLSPQSGGKTADVSYSAYLDTGNTAHTSVPAGTLIGSGGPATITSPAGSHAFTDQQIVVANSDYSLTLQLQAVIHSAASSSAPNKLSAEGNVQVQAVPEPASLVLLSMGLAGIGGAAFRRWKDKPVAC